MTEPSTAHSCRVYPLAKAARNAAQYASLAPVGSIQCFMKEGVECVPSSVYTADDLSCLLRIKTDCIPKSRNSSGVFTCILDATCSNSLSLRNKKSTWEIIFSRYPGSVTWGSFPTSKNTVVPIFRADTASDMLYSGSPEDETCTIE